MTEHRLEWVGSPSPTPPHPRRAGCVCGDTASVLTEDEAELWAWLHAMLPTEYPAFLAQWAAERGITAAPRNIPHGATPARHAGAMDTSTLVSRLQSLAQFLQHGRFSVSWLYVDPTDDGPTDATRTIHTVELDGDTAGMVLGNFQAFIGALDAVEHVTADATPGRVSLEALGTGADGAAVRGVAIILDPWATALATSLGLDPTTTTTTHRDLTVAQAGQIAADPFYQQAPATAPTSDPSGATSSTTSPPDPASAAPDPSSTTPSPQPSPSPQPDPAASQPASDPSAPAVTPDPVTTTIPTTPDPTQVTTSDPTQTPGATPAPVSVDSSSATSPASPADPATSATAGGPTDPTAGGVTVRSQSDAPVGADTSAPSPDPTQTGPQGPAPVATGQQPGTPDGALTNADGTPVEPTAGTSADVGPASVGTGGVFDPSQGGQTPVAVSSDPLPSGASDPSTSASTGTDSTPPTPAPVDSSQTGPAAISTADSSGPSSDQAQPSEDFGGELAALQAQMDAIRARQGGSQPATGDGGQHEAPDPGSTPVTVTSQPDPIGAGGTNIASGQGGGTAGDPAAAGSGTPDASAAPVATDPSTQTADGF